jgi:hypothetical protein
LKVAATQIKSQTCHTKQQNNKTKQNNTPNQMWFQKTLKNTTTSFQSISTKKTNNKKVKT